jgi:putative colanic acid biosynthesis UDP-glucose lipid carrier transferase
LTTARVSAIADVLFRWLLLLVVLLAIGYVTKSFAAYPRRIFLTWAVVTPAALVLVTLIMQEIMHRFVMSAFENRKAIFAGYNNSSLELARRLTNNPVMRLEVTGFFDDRSTDRLGMESDAKLIGTLSDLSAYVKEHVTDVIFIALPIRHVKRVMNLLDDLRDTTASIYYVPDIFVFDLIQARSGEIHGIPVVAMCETPFYGYRGVTKRLTDIGLSITSCCCSCPCSTIACWSAHPRGPVIFAAPLRPRWPGNRRLQISNHDGDRGRRRDPAGIETDSRITRIGGILRRTSMDELPQLISPQGRMSLVGPRPHAVAHNGEYRKLIRAT